MEDYVDHDRAVWERIFASMPAEWYEAPPSDAMIQCRAYFEAHRCDRLLDVGCGFGRWAQFLSGHGIGCIVGVDYAEGGIRSAGAWARREGFDAHFLIGSAMALPFRDGSFDGVLAALVLDNLSRTDCRRAVQNLNAVVRVGGRGFFVFNPAATPADVEVIPKDNPTKGCMRVAYRNHELAILLAGWSVTRLGVSAEGFRLIEATRVSENAAQQGDAPGVARCAAGNRQAVGARTTRDKFGREVSVGSRVRLIQLSEQFLRSLPSDEFAEVSAMVGEVFEVYEIDQYGCAWIEKGWSYPEEGKFMGHSLGLDPHEMVLVDDKAL